jgi:hypothetical protein
MQWELMAEEDRQILLDKLLDNGTTIEKLQKDGIIPAKLVHNMGPIEV